MNTGNRPKLSVNTWLKPGHSIEEVKGHRPEVCGRPHIHIWCQRAFLNIYNNLFSHSRDSILRSCDNTSIDLLARNRLLNKIILSNFRFLTLKWREEIIIGSSTAQLHSLMQAFVEAEKSLTITVQIIKLYYYFCHVMVCLETSLLNSPWPEFRTCSLRNGNKRRVISSKVEWDDGDIETTW